MNAREKNELARASAVILRFPRKRGRPRSEYTGHDTGTPELVMKRAHGQTTEALDMCLERGVITRSQHWCGIHLRWLYTLRHGAPNVRALDPSDPGGMDIKTDDPEWRAAREKEYHEAVQKLAGSGHMTLLLALCVYNEPPRGLRNASDARAAQTLSRLREGLDILADYWRR